MAEILEAEGRIDVLVVSAGVHVSGSIELVTEAEFDRVMGINFKGAFFLVQAVIPSMKARGSGCIALIGSDQCLVGKANSAIYGASKGAMGQLTKSLAIDYGPHGIRVNCVCAGTIETPLYHRAVERYCVRSGAVLEEVHKAEGEEQCLGRIGQPGEIAAAVLFLCSPGGGFVTGALLPVDGGYSAK